MHCVARLTIAAVEPGRLPGSRRARSSAAPGRLASPEPPPPRAGPPHGLDAGSPSRQPAVAVRLRRALYNPARVGRRSQGPAARSRAIGGEGEARSDASRSTRAERRLARPSPLSRAGLAGRSRIRHGSNNSREALTSVVVRERTNAMVRRLTVVIGVAMSLVVARDASADPITPVDLDSWVGGSSVNILNFDWFLRVRDAPAAPRTPWVSCLATCCLTAPGTPMCTG